MPGYMKMISGIAGKAARAYGDSGQNKQNSTSQDVSKVLNSFKQPKPKPNGLGKPNV